MTRMAALEGAIRVRTKRSNGRALENDGISLSQLDLSSGFARGLQDGRQQQFSPTCRSYRMETNCSLFTPTGFTGATGTMISRGPGASLSTSDLGSYGSSLQSGPISPFSSQARAVFDGTPTPSASVTASPGLVSSSTGTIAGSVIAHPASISEPMSKPRVRINGGPLR